MHFAPTTADIQAQQAWEVAGTQSAIELVREAVARSREDITGRPSSGRGEDVMALPAGQALLLKTVPLLSQAIRAACDSPAGDLLDGSRAAKWAWPAHRSCPEKLAVITVAHCLHLGSGVEFGVPSQALEISNTATDQLAYDDWAAEKNNKDSLASLKKRYPTLTRQAWARWQKKIGEDRGKNLPKKQAIHFGTFLLHLLTTTCPEYFIIALEWSGKNKSLFVRPTDLTLSVMLDAEQRAAISHPRFLPMICPPQPWAYTPSPQGAAA